MKIGDKVRFLNEVGGGYITGFQGKDTVLVEDEDGFDVPVLKKECVVIATDDYNNVLTKQEQIKQEVEAETNRSEVLNERVVETKEGDVLNVYLAFVPKDIKKISTTSFDAYIINDSNYFLYYTYSNQQNKTDWSVRSHDLIAPNTKVYIETFMKSNLNELEQIRVQLISFKRDRNFEMKDPVDKIVDIDTVKFYKLHSFKENDFFIEPILKYAITENDNLSKGLDFDVEQLKENMLSKNNSPLSKSSVSDSETTSNKKGIIEVDLHIDELLDSTKGLDSKDMLTYQLNKFREIMDMYKSKKNQKIVFIHGKGEGVLRKMIIQEVRKNYKSCTYQDASFQEYGFGATMITIH